jgi:fucose 4-O-acetylase-like acetyltransferase
MLNFTTKNTSRNNFIAIAKAIGIICVVIWHARPPESLGIFTMLFAVPLFFFTSGYFYKPSTSLIELKNFYIKRIKGLYLPFVKWSLFFLFLHNILYHFNIYNGLYGFRGEVSQLYTYMDFRQRFFNILFKMLDVEQLLGAFWFIRALFISMLVIATIQFVFHRWKFINRYFMFLGLLLVSYVTIHYNIRLPLIGSLGLISFSSTFYVLGYCYRKIESDKCYTIFITFLSTFVTFLGLIYFDHVVGILGIEDKYVFLYEVLAFSGIIMVLNVSKLIERFSIKTFFYYVGNNTMIILALHLVCLKVISLLKIVIYGWPIERLSEFPVIEQNNTVWWVGYVIAGVSIPLLIQKYYDKIKLKYIFKRKKNKFL